MLTVLVSLFFFLTGTAQQLQPYLTEALENNPDIQAFELRYETAKEKVEEVGVLPETQFSVGYFASEPETRTGPQQYKLSVQQMIPWFGTITARENYASSLADAQYVEIATAQRQLLLNVAENYYRLYAIRAKQRVLEENIDLLEAYEQLALTSLEVNQASSVDVLRLQMRQNQLRERFENFDEEFKAEQATFNALLNTRPGAAVEVYDSLAVPQEDPVQLPEVPQVHPELLRFDKLYESVGEAEKMNRKEALPDLGFGLDYVAVGEATAMQAPDSGKDILMPMVSITVPIFGNKYKSVTRQNELKQRELNAQRENRHNELVSRLEAAVSNRAEARISYRTQLLNIEQANDAEEILRRNYETGTIDFNDVLDVQELQLNFELNLIEAVKNYYQASANINYLSE
ncbi:TolC family protein [Salegentibacter mishustinae]|uniref:Transporter n=3 Tax=Flavobacteriaceae TaxID=49546 RepID=A0A0Q9ZA22_9FLAO|nr:MULTISPECIES: TolC family protein [Flavobacteriaceae]KRG29836.1 transporter [Salegentibacter mishustinae]MDT0650237.1 TolC family protein [Zunongwangia sp. F297]PNW22705.1 transporter [Salegentibacter mishustinae]UBZ08847.1 TolC family protein [Salegentibacter mishustinae]